jgi:hypothetical protein
MVNQRKLFLAASAIAVTLALTIWDIRNWATIGKMGMAWDTGAPIWPYQTSDILLRLLNFPAYVVGMPVSNLLGLKAPEHHLVVLPFSLGFWLLIGTRSPLGRGDRPRHRWIKRGAILIMILGLLSCAIGLLSGAYRWWSVYGQQTSFGWLELLRTVTPALWCVLAALALALQTYLVKEGVNGE